MKPPFFVPALVAISLCTCSYFAPSARGADPPDASQEVSVQSPDSVTLSIPGPLRSFLRMAGMSQKISPEEVAPLLARNVFQQTEDPQRAFLTVDSGFPLPQLEQSLRDAQTFTYPFASTRVPALLADSDWSRKGNAKDWDLLDA